jgi:hypothetical protein
MSHGTRKEKMGCGRGSKFSVAMWGWSSRQRKVYILDSGHGCCQVNRYPQHSISVPKHDKIFKAQGSDKRTSCMASIQPRQRRSTDMVSRLKILAGLSITFGWNGLKVAFQRVLETFSNKLTPNSM